MNITRTPLFFALFLALGFELLPISYGYAQADSEKSKLPQVFVARAARKTFVDKIEALGTLRAKESVELTATVTEIISAIHFEDGQRVDAGYVLAEMTNTEEHAMLSEARSQLAEAKSQYQRLQPLLAEGAASASVVDARKNEFETAKARKQAIQSRMSDRLIAAPFSGIVGLRNISVGALVEPGDLITTLDDDSEMKLDFTVPSTLLKDIKIGLPIEASAPGLAKEKVTGTVVSIGSRVDPVTRSVTVRAILPNPDLVLKPGLLMTVYLSSNERETLVIPEEALVPKGETSSVFVVAENDGLDTLEKRDVEIGARRSGEVEILSGLTAGERVVTHGTLTARAGQGVEVRAEEKNDEPLAELLSSKEQTSK